MNKKVIIENYTVNYVLFTYKYLFVIVLSILPQLSVLLYEEFR